MSDQNILVIKHGSLGDWIHATGAFKLIRNKYPKANIVMLTQQHYLPLALKCCWFNQVCIDNRLPFYKLFQNLKIIKKLRSYNYDHVYDLQCSNRTKIYHRLIHDKTKNWYGRAKNCSHYVPFRPYAHSVEFSYDIIKASGIDEFPIPDITWLTTDNIHKKIKILGRFALFIPGSSAKHSAKRWLASRYAEVIDWLHKRNIKSVLTGTEIDRQIINDIIQKCSAEPINLINQAGFAEMAELAQSACIVIGSDTGPMHIAAATKACSIVLFTGASDAQRSRPWGSNAHVISKNSIESLSVKDVVNKITELLKF